MHISIRNLTSQRSSDRRLLSAGRRDGIVLLVVIAMLALFAMVGLSFVYYSESVALAARYNRAGITSDLRDIPPERILSRFLSDLIFDTDDSASQLSGLSLGRNMYGGPGGRFAYSGTGYDLNGPNTTYSGIRSTQEFLFGRGNAPYTFPDMNNPYLAWVDENGALQARSYFRKGTALRATGISPPSQPGEGDVKNLEGLTQITDFTQTATNPNLQYQFDSFWIDPNYTGQTKEGINYKILIAPLVLDLDGRVNLATAGDLYSTAYQNGGFSSRGGMGPWEINPARLFDSDATLKTAFPSLLSNASVPSRFGNGVSAPATPLPLSWFSGLAPGNSGPVYARFPMNGNEPNFTVTAKPLTPFPTFPVDAGGNPAWKDPIAGQQHPAMFDYHRAAFLRNNPGDRRLAVSNTEALLRYGEAGTAGVTSDIFRNMTGLDFSNANHQKLRHLLTTFNMSADVPHLPAFLPFTGTYKIAPVAANANLTPAQSLNIPVLPPQATQFATTTNLDQNRPDPMSADSILSNLMVPNLKVAIPPNNLVIPDGRFNLNQPIVNPNVQAAQILGLLCNQAGLPVPDPTKWQFTGSGYNDTSTNPPTQIDLPTYKYLAQIAVNLVDYMDSDNTSTIFNWSGQRNSADVDYVFGVEQPRLLINEAYCTFDNDDKDLKDNNNMQATFYRLNVFFELLNPSPNAQANLAEYQVLVVKDTTGMDTTATGTPSNLIVDPPGTTVTVNNWNVAKLDPNAGGFNSTGFLVVGPPLNKDPAAHDTFPDSRRPNFTPTGLFYQEPKLSIHISPPNGDSSQPPKLFAPTIVLQRLAVPGQAVNNDAKSPAYNPYVTVDFFEFQPGQYNPGTNGFSSITLIGSKNMKPPLPASAPDDLNKFHSYGRMQPLAASNVVAQNPTLPVSTDTNLPLNTFWRHNSQDGTKAPTKPGDQTITVPFDWCAHLDRPLVNRGELLSLSTSSLPSFTHKFGAANSTLTDAMNMPNSLLARMFECMYVPTFEFNSGINGVAGANVPGALVRPLMRVPGKVNVNTMASKKVAYALFDPQSDSNFATPDVDDFYSKLDTLRKTAPSATQGPIAGFSDSYYGSPANAAPVPPPQPQIQTRGGLLQLINSSQLSAGKKSLAKDEAIRKIANNVTFTSNTFAVWLTVGFFEQRVDTSTTPPTTKLVELFSEENRQIRHRMFAIIDRSQLMMPTQTLTTVATAPVPGTLFPTMFPAAATKATSWKLDVGNSFSGTWANTFSPVGTVSMEWKFSVGGTVQVGSQVGHIIAVTPKSSTSTANYIEVAFPTINGNAPPPPAQGDPISFPSPITMLPPPLTELGVVTPPAPSIQPLQYGYPGPQPRFNVADNPYVVPYFTIIE